MAYMGELGLRGRSLVRYLSARPGVAPYPAGMNVSSWMLDALAGTNSSAATGVPAPAAAPVAVAPAAASAATSAVPDAKSVAAAETASLGGGSAMLPGPELQAALLASPTWKVASAIIEANSNPAPGAVAVTFASARARSLGAQYALLVGRQWRSHKRNVGLNFGRLLALTLLGIVFGIVWQRAARNTTNLSGVQTLIAAIFMVRWGRMLALLLRFCLLSWAPVLALLMV
jgi:hypothetical protein